MRGSCVIFSSNAGNGLNAGSFYLTANNDTSLELGLNNKLLRGSRYES